VETPSDRKANTSRRAVLVLLCILAIASLGVIYFVGDLARLQEKIAAGESQAVLRGITDPEQLDEALRQHPSNKTLKLIALANTASTATDAATRKLLDDAEPAALSKGLNLGAANRGDLEALQRALKTAENNAATFMPRYVALIKTARDELETNARALNAADSTVARFMATIDQQNKETTTATSDLLAARVEFYRAYGKCVALLLREFGIYKVSNGQFVFPLQSTANGYNLMAAAMATAASRIAELEEQRRTAIRSRLSRWKQFAEAG